MTWAVRRRRCGSCSDAKIPVEIGIWVTVGPVNSAVPKMREVEGLRAIAVLAVLLFHTNLGLRGGYVGVDVFFVVSGFLITTLLASERELTGRVSLWNFYARRVRRLLPLAVLVVAATIAAAWKWMDQVTASSLGIDAVWSSLFAANMRFARVGTDYLTATDAPSALQHFWSLAIEEQFYLLWPVLLVAVWRTGRNRLKSASWLAAAVTVASFWVCMELSQNQQVWAFFSLPSRAWELAAGALLAGVLRYIRISVRVIAPAIGLAVLAVTFVALPSTSAFPGPLALVPVVATLAVLCSINTGTRVARGLSHPLLQWIGSRSYALYLWHWPLIVITEYRIGQLTIPHRLGLLAGTFLLAEVSHRLVETPLRRARSLARRPRATVGLGLAFAVFTAGGGAALAMRDASTATGHNASASSPASASTSPTTTTEAPSFSARQLNDYVIGPRSQQLRVDLAQDVVPQNVTPSLSKASKDKPVPFINGCLADMNSTTNPPCFAGNPSLPEEVVLFGDSKAAQWFPGMWVAGKRAGWRVSVISKAACPAAAMSVNKHSGSSYTSCDTWRVKALERINASNATVVVISSNWYVAASGQRSWSAALTETVNALRQAGKKVVIFSNTPVWETNPATCAARNLTNLQACSQPLAAVTSQARNREEAAVAAKTGAMFFDVAKWLCTNTCPVISGSTMMYMDPIHISATMSEALDKPLELAIRAALESAER